MPDVVVLLPPSEGKAAGGSGESFDPATGEFGELSRARRGVVQGLRRRDFDASQLKVSGAALAAARSANRSIIGAPTLPALSRYTGVLYAELGYAALPVSLQRDLERNVLVISGLLGVAAGDDPVPAYKLPIGASVPRLGRLAAYWKPRLASVLIGRLSNSVVWDLLPGAYAAAVPRSLGTAHWRVAVLRERGGRRVSVSHDNKAVKGALARTLVAEQIRRPEELAGWVGPGGYRVESVSPGNVVELITRG